MDVQDDDVPFLKLADDRSGFGDMVKTIGHPKGGPLQDASGEVHSVGEGIRSGAWVYAVRKNGSFSRCTRLDRIALSIRDYKYFMVFGNISSVIA